MKSSFTTPESAVFFRPSQLEPLGVPYHRLRQLEAVGVVERVGSGLYRLAAAEPTERYSIAFVCARVPNAIVCLLSALQVYEIGTQLPHQVWIAIPNKAKPPALTDVGVRLVRFSGAARRYGVLETTFEGVPARITSPARTVVDCFRFERLIGRGGGAGGATGGAVGQDGNHGGADAHA